MTEAGGGRLDGEIGGRAPGGGVVVHEGGLHEVGGVQHSGVGGYA